ncbi:hypothetical protein OG216_09755 [Streptomycetaceae bacterium NBC_01309]
MSDAIPPHLIELQRAVYRAQAAIRTYAQTHPRVLDNDEAAEWERLHQAANDAARALYADPAKASFGWRELMDAAQADDPAGSDRSD